MADRELSRARVVDSLSRGGFVSPDAEADVLIAAAGNGVDARLGDLDEPLPHSLHGRVDVMTAVVPYVPTEALHLLPRDVLAHEPRRALDGGDGGTAMLGRAAEAAARLVRPGGSVLLELGGTQADPVSARLRAPGFEAIRVHRDDDGFDRALEARKASTSSVEGREL